MRPYPAALLLALLMVISIVGATDSSSYEDIARPKVTFSPVNASEHLDHIHHLECQRNISQEHRQSDTLRDQAHLISSAFDKDLQLLNKQTLETCTQVYKDMANPELRSYRAQLSDAAPLLFNSPIERFVSAGQIFLSGLDPLKHKAQELASMNQRNMSDCMRTLKGYCEGTLQPCIGDKAFASRKRSPLELKACNKINTLDEITQAAKAWKNVVRDVGEIRKLFSSTWGLVKDAQEDEHRAAEEWVAIVVAKWISMLEDLLVRAQKRRTGGIAMGTPTVPLPLFYVPIRLGWLG
ncbi:unnamed protein product [Aureobasidium uvarum]|uniref:Uncharacterized protein n=1 Tax=Aureobasidium uvarum TaxID=2773716 RepID=A0A9N8KMJ8_9PEZI|nr:unnamed protein product [Aureobasidium uvarum]